MTSLLLAWSVSLMNLTDALRELASSFIELLQTSVFCLTNFCSHLYVHSSAKLGFHLRLFITLPEVAAEVTNLRPFVFFYNRHRVLQPSLRYTAAAYRNFWNPLFLFSVNSEYLQISPLTFSVTPGSCGNVLLVFQTIFLQQIPI